MTDSVRTLPILLFVIACCGRTLKGSSNCKANSSIPTKNPVMINVAGILVGNKMGRTVNEVVPVEMHSKIQKKQLGNHILTLPNDSNSIQMVHIMPMVLVPTTILRIVMYDVYRILVREMKKFVPNYPSHHIVPW